MRRRGTGFEVAQGLELERRRRRRLLQPGGELDGPAAGVLHLCARHPGMQRDDGEFLAVRRRLPDREVGDQQRRAFRGEAELLPVVAAGAVAEGGEEIDLVDKTAPRLLHGDEDLAAGGGDFRSAAAAGQPRLWMIVVADDGGVDVAEAVELGGTEKADGDAAALQPVAEHLGYRDGGDREGAGVRVPDGER